MPDKPPVMIVKTHTISTEAARDQPEPTSNEPASNNAASNGYWIHDELGPKNYIAPPDANGVEFDEGDMVKRIGAMLTGTPGIDASRIQVALEKGVILINGIAVSAMESRLAARAVQMVAGDVRVVNRLVIDEALDKLRPS